MGKKGIDKYKDIRFGVDLVRASQHLLVFLRRVDQNPGLYDDRILRKALYRYEVLWLPLAAKHADRCLVAPLDIAWVWLVHILSPVTYREDCKKLFDCVIDHKVVEPDAMARALEKSEALWNEEYPHEIFHMDLTYTDNDSPPTANGLPPKIASPETFESKLSYDIFAAAQRQKLFYYQVSLPHYHDKLFLSTAVNRYKMFLFLKRSNPDTFLVPCYDFDLVWHAHQAHPSVYFTDTMTVLNKVLKHDDSVSDRTAGSKLTLANDATTKMWSDRFNETFSRCGGMFRGNPPLNLLAMDLGFIQSMAGKVYGISIQSVAITNVAESQGPFSVTLSLDRIGGGRHMKSRIVKLQSRQGTFSDDQGIEWKSGSGSTPKLDAITVRDGHQQKIYIEIIKNGFCDCITPRYLERRDGKKWTVL